MALRLTVPTFQVHHSVALNIRAVPSSSGTSWTSLLPKQSSTPAKQRLTEPCRHHSVLRLWVSDYSTLRANILIQHESFYNRLVSLTVSSRSHQCCGVGMSVRPPYSWLIFPGICNPCAVLCMCLLMGALLVAMFPPLWKLHYREHECAALLGDSACNQFVCNSEVEFLDTW